MRIALASDRPFNFRADRVFALGFSLVNQASRRLIKAGEKAFLKRRAKRLVRETCGLVGGACNRHSVL